MVTERRSQSPDPIPSIEWEITTRCNYHCSYCSQLSYSNLLWADSSDRTVEAVLRLLDELPGSWLIKVSGGEPFVHNRFLEIAKIIASSRHRICTTTNFSAPQRVLDEFLDITGDSLEYLTASLHLEQVPHPSFFMAKAKAFQLRKPPGSKFLVTTVGVEKKLEDLHRIADECAAAGIAFEVAPMKEHKQYIEYHDDEFISFLKKWPLRNTERLREMKLFRTRCNTGYLFVRITVEGDVLCCYNLQPRFFLGNIAEGTFRWLDQPKPCLAARCTCTVPANRNMIEYGNRVSQSAALVDYASAVVHHGGTMIRVGSRWVDKGLKLLLRTVSNPNE